MLTEAQAMTRDMARRFAQERLLPTAPERDRTAQPPLDLLREMGDLGLMGMCVPEEWGGAGTDFVSYVLAIEEIAAGDGAVSTIMSVNNSLVCASILNYGTEEQKKRFLDPLARGQALGAFALTEPQAGSDAAALEARAVDRGDHFALTGTKQFITSGSIATHALVFAVTDPEQGKRGISAFIVETDQPGWQIGRIEEKLGQHCSDTAQVVLDEARAGVDQMLGARGDGYRIALANLEAGRIGIAAQAVGMARAALEAAVDYARQRETFGKPIIQHQAVAFRLADMATQVEASHQMVLHAARLRDAGQPCLKEASMAKLFASEAAERVCSDAIQVHGGYGYVADFPVERIYRDVRICQIYEGTSDIQRMVISRALGAG
ncbi:MAG: acyl-CoA dehydrogenase family protein [Dehalococcoidia bacterium]|nr:acyl-CoA dehydrogenase family protein [Dehalococcoidia bacterium]